MSRDLNDLQPEFRGQVVELLSRCRSSGFNMVPFFTKRTVYKQAKLWRQSRPTIEINAAIDMLTANKAFFLADVLDKVGPQFGQWATNALPGQSWHQWGAAIDCFWLQNDRAIWDNPRGYEFYATEAENMGLTAGFFWSTRPDWVHVQQSSGKILGTHTWKEINDTMEERFKRKE